MTDDAIRDHVQRVLSWEDAHVGFDKATAGVPVDVRGRRARGAPYSPWELLEHLRITQNDILDFCRNPEYTEKHWPDDYWPPAPAPPTKSAWAQSVRSFRDDREELRLMAADPRLDLTATIPHGSGQTYLRELLLVADHNAYHIGQLIVVRRLLGIWK